MPEKSGIDLYLLDESGSTFKATVLYDPYFYVLPKTPAQLGVSTRSNDEADSVYHELLTTTLLRKYESSGLARIDVVRREDLDEVNHLGRGKNGRAMLKLVFDNVQQLMDVRREIMDIVRANQRRESEDDAALVMFQQSLNQQAMGGGGSKPEYLTDPLSTLVDIREYDVPYLVRTCIDLGIRTGAWYTVTPNTHDVGCTLTDQDFEKKGDPSFLAFDIECTKAPLKFPDANVDSIFMISYMIRGQGYLIISRDVVSQDVDDFEYTPKPIYPGPFKIFNEATEEDLIRRFLSHYRELRPQIVVTYNGDFFDWPFLEQRAAVYGLDIRTELGVERIGDEYRGRCSVHLDAFSWVKRDSYLPQGAQGLKAVTKYKLGYDPVEVDPEEMVRFAKERPAHMASYSVSDAVATYYLYEKYVHLFIFSLCTIIPIGPEDVLRKGSGTLCETLLMEKACTKEIICPNKHVDPLAKFHDGHLLEAETYIGGKVECLETGVYRSDFEYDFDMKPSAFQQLIDNVDRDLTFAIEVEGGLKKVDMTNYEEIKNEIVTKLADLRDRPKRVEKPFVYHLDVGAMYPNIILTNRLQPTALVDDATCAACDFNQAKNGCKKKMNWVWRGDYNPATKSEYDRTKDQLSRETFEDGQSFHELPAAEQAELISKRLKIYSKNAYKKTKVTEEVTKTDTVCMRENGFYVDTVREFRDRRYEYKSATKMWKKKVGDAKNATDKKDAEDRALVYDSLQVAHKCILNSFYGYVMRKGARWRSIEMAGIVTKTGADLITQARILVEQIGRPLELDTDGIWCILPRTFPDVYNFKCSTGKSFKLEYPCVMLNADVHEHFTNHQYQTLTDADKRTYSTRKENSIFFEVDGPYRAMILPSSTEEGKLLKKRYAVFNFDGSLAELKGFELKRRGELELIKTFQSQVFERFLDGTSLKECYDSVADIANHWIDILETQGESLETDELVDLISENRNMSRQLEDYGDQKGTSQTTARRLGEFLGAELIKDKGLNCKFILADRPYGAPITDRAIPVAIWKAEDAVMKHYLRKWLKSPGMEEDDFDIRNVLDWDYYKGRLGRTIQKIITIPAALQKVENPVPRIKHPDWLQSTVRRLNDPMKQQNITSMFSAKPKRASSSRNERNSSPVSLGIRDIEDAFGGSKRTGPGRPLVRSARRRRGGSRTSISSANDMDVIEAAPTFNGDQEEASATTALSKDMGKEGYNKWLERKKEMWRNARQERKRLRQIRGDNGSKGDSKRLRRGAGDMQGYIRDAANALKSSDWQVLEVRELSSSESKFPTSTPEGEFILWVMVGSDSLQKVHITVPRTVYIDCLEELEQRSNEIVQVKRVEKHLPHNKAGHYMYEVTMSEGNYRTKDWANMLLPDKNAPEDTIKSIYGMGTPLMLRALIDVGCITRVNRAGLEMKRNSYSLQHLSAVPRPSGGEYLHRKLSYRRVFLYESLHPRSKTGLIAFFVLRGGSGRRNEESDDQDITRPSESSEDSVRLSASCHFWVVKPGGRKGQKNVTIKSCENMFEQIVSQIKEMASADETSEYSCLSPSTHCKVEKLSFVNTERDGYAGVNEVLQAYAQGNHGPTLLMLNTTKPLSQLRRAVPSCNGFPLITMPFPPGPQHNTSMSTRPALNWEPLAVQLCLEAYLFLGIVSFPKRVMTSRYGNVPIGNLGKDENTLLYDVYFGRLLQKSRAVSWANDIPGSPDLGCNAMALLDAGTGADSVGLCGDGALSSNDMWGDEDELVSPVIRRPGAYRCICVEIDIHDLSIAALTDLKLAAMSATQAAQDGSMFGADGSSAIISNDTPLGDEMSTAISLPLLRALVQGWLQDAYGMNSLVADDLLHEFYRLVCNPEAALNDPTLHRVVHSLMKTTFLRLLGEFQRLGSTIVCGTFNKIVVATNKTDIFDAKEYIDFAISTIQNGGGTGNHNPIEGGLGRIALQPNNYYSDYLFLDEHNFGGIHFEQRDIEDEDERDWAMHWDQNGDVDPDAVPIIPTVVSGWNTMHFLASEISQEYFRAIIGRFSKDIYRKQVQIRAKMSAKSESKSTSPSSVRDLKGDEDISPEEQLIRYKKKLISKHFSSYLTRAVGEIMKDGGGPESFPRLPGSHLQLSSPVLEFVKNILVILELDPDVENEVSMLKKSLFAQVGVQEYSADTKWQNPCASFVLPDVFCMECHESRDVNLCILPPPDEDDEHATSWRCYDCNNPYDSETIERRLVDIVQRKSTRYQLQDLRCSKTERVAIRTLARQSESSAPLKLDISRQEFNSQIVILHSLAKYYSLEWLQETTTGLLKNL